MVDVKPDEISAIFKQQLSGFETESQLEEVGTVLQVGDGIARVYGLIESSDQVSWLSLKTELKRLYLTLKKIMWVWYCWVLLKMYQRRCYC